MISRAIVIFPQFNNISKIDEIREKYDPLCNYIAPHITLVFPFKSEHTNHELLEFIKEQLKEIKPFNIMAKGITGASDGYIFLELKTGNDNIIKLHDMLYEGILKSHHNKFIPYIPHITIGKLANDTEQREIVELLSSSNTEYHAIIEKISIEIIDNPEKSTTEYEFVF